MVMKMQMDYFATPNNCQEKSKDEIDGRDDSDSDACSDSDNVYDNDDASYDDDEVEAKEQRVFSKNTFPTVYYCPLA